MPGRGEGGHHAPKHDRGRVARVDVVFSWDGGHRVGGIGRPFADHPCGGSARLPGVLLDNGIAATADDTDVVFLARRPLE